MKRRAPLLVLGLLAWLGRAPRLAAGAPGLEWRGGTLLYQGQPYSGWVDGDYSAGKPESRRYYKEGQCEGVHRGWWPSGHQRYLYRFRHGLLQGECWEWYGDGRPYRLMTYCNGQEQGRQIIWASDGSRLSDYQQLEGRRFGLVNTRPCRGKP
jgi:hypothetical protein